MFSSFVTHVIMFRFYGVVLQFVSYRTCKPFLSLIYYNLLLEYTANTLNHALQEQYCLLNMCSRLDTRENKSKVFNVSVVLGLSGSTTNV